MLQQVIEAAGTLAAAPVVGVIALLLVATIGLSWELRRRTDRCERCEQAHAAVVAELARQKDVLGEKLGERIDALNQDRVNMAEEQAKNMMEILREMLAAVDQISGQIKELTREYGDTARQQTEKLNEILEGLRDQLKAILEARRTGP